MDQLRPRGKTWFALQRGKIVILTRIISIGKFNSLLSLVHILYSEQ